MNIKLAKPVAGLLAIPFIVLIFSSLLNASFNFLVQRLSMLLVYYFSYSNNISSNADILFIIFLYKIN